MRQGDDSRNQRPEHPRWFAAFPELFGHFAAGHHGTSEDFEPPETKLGNQPTHLECLVLRETCLLLRGDWDWRHCLDAMQLGLRLEIVVEEPAHFNPLLRNIFVELGGYGA